jgi:hypothetical protein
LTAEDFARVMALLKFGPIQFCLFVKPLVGTEPVEGIMVEITGVARPQN